MGQPLLGGAEGAYPCYIKLAAGPGDTTVLLSTYGLAYDATTNPRGIASVDDYTIWCEEFGTNLCLKTASKTGAQFILTHADAAHNDLYVTVWIVPNSAGMRTVL